jgi:hypothetical protein
VGVWPLACASALMWLLLQARASPNTVAATPHLPPTLRRCVHPLNINIPGKEQDSYPPLAVKRLLQFTC